jgi:hypothetical protein
VSESNSVSQAPWQLPFTKEGVAESMEEGVAESIVSGLSHDNKET